MRKLLVGIFLFAFMTNVNAEECSDVKIKELQQKAENITISTEFNEENVFLEQYDVSFITIQGLTEGFYIYSSDRKYLYEYSDNINGIINDTITSDAKTLYIYNDICPNKVIKEINLSLKRYNPFSDYDECNGRIGEELDVCDKFYNKKLTEEEFYEKVKEYNKKHKLLENNNRDKNTIIYYIIGGVLVIAIIVLLIIRRKRNILD